MRRPLTAVVLVLVLGAGLTACGSDDGEFSDVVPRSTPDLVVSDDSGLPPVRTTGNDDTGSATTGPTGPTSSTGSTSSGSAATPAPATQTPAQPEQQGGTAAPQQPTSTTGEGSGGFSDFCEQNPGACGE